MIKFGSEMLGNLSQAIKHEWLETNGLGGFASSTIIGLNTRRYHGLLVAAANPPAGRTLLLSKLEETLIYNGQRFDLSANQYPGAIHPEGYRWMKSFRLDPFPIFTWELDDLQIEKSLFLVYGENTVVVDYRLVAPLNSTVECRLEIRPLISFRDYHGTTHENNALDPRVDADGTVLSIHPYDGLPGLYFAHTADEYEATGHWYRNFEYRIEQERGLDYLEDLFNPLELRFDLSANPTASLIASTTKRNAGETEDLRQAEIFRRENLCAAFPGIKEPLRTLVVAADQFIVARADLKSIIAGYPWFADWGRDTMIALPGLTIATRRFDLARGILLEFSRHIDQGMLPNRFPDGGEALEYNTIDATLWYFEAARAYSAAANDSEFIRDHLYDRFVEIIDWHIRGTRYHIHLEPDGLLYAGEPGIQLTWMDAKVDDWVVTPRIGKPVEIQALWYNALCIMTRWANKFGDTQNEMRFQQLAQQAKASFNESFWNDAAGALFDVIDGERQDSSIRPNQIIALSLPYSMLDPERARSVLDKVEKDLLTPYGLRSLAACDRQYNGRYEGGVRERDGAYHQGTVWAWLIGPFISAYLNVHGFTDCSRAKALGFLDPLLEYASSVGLGQIPEIFDGDPPFRPRGCYAQAWSVAEILRSLEALGAMSPIR